MGGSSGTIAVCGGKGAGLVMLTAAELPVPPAFFVTTAAFEAGLGATVRSIDDELAALPEDLAPGQLEHRAAAIRERVMTVSAAHPLLDRIAEAYARLTDGADAAVAVRSSSVLEDGAEASYAGEHDSYLWVEGAEQVLASVRQCWASLYTARAIRYRMRSARMRAPSMAVVVQRMVDARAAGVFMTLNPANGDRSSLVVESVWGIGEPLVSGLVSPDRFTIDKVTGDLRRRDLAHKPERVVRCCGGPQRRPVAAQLRDAPSLDDEHLARLHVLARGVEGVLGRPADGEFAVDDDGAVWLLQARPETVWSNRPRSLATAPAGSVMQAVLNTLSSS